ncbi:anaerobic coproporphyrinogen III oxidase [Limnobacter thiooxidans]|uniref:Heme chaperone HemW n=2 Tax=Limnobacter thiooxidans TaxID=131080 RepID=A0AA86MAZ7_9BURK|nr:radical SAM family heme chaperone HemW [Limnobacter sp.]MCZ8015892.1 radical SAM family heme chaperone HemW [Limnobacter sp.]RZS42974.1 anaerobic coproporphyrinogen III oxidase [Limnobacter thiooxidans]BET25588.1 radical SAM family heme chaperone HemW [Limnobacter thiooxidans]
MSQPVDPSNNAPAFMATSANNLVGRVFMPSELRFAAMPPLALYIHLPWCVRKCPYCDFNSHLAPESKLREVAVPVHSLNAKPVESTEPAEQGYAASLPLDLQRRYLNALIADLDQQLPKIWGRKLYSIFIGGGTPSLFEPSLIDELIAAVRARLGMPQTGEITMEANPGTFEQARFEGYRKAGVNRLSIGVQSFSDSHLKALGRVHNGGQAIDAVRSAVALFDEVNIDLMYALPHQSVDQALADVKQALSLNTTHLSLYQLTMEPNTLFAAKPPPLPDDDTLVDIEEAVQGAARNAGFEHYEISAFAKPGHRSQHNLNYWGFGDYLGIGAGAHAKISYPNRIERETRHRNPMAYMDEMEGAAQPLEVSTVAVRDLPFEFMLNAMRLLDGVPEAWFEERCGRPLIDLQKGLNLALKKGLLDSRPGTLKPTETGLRFLNDLQMIFLPKSV